MSIIEQRLTSDIGQRLTLEVGHLTNGSSKVLVIKEKQSNESLFVGSDLEVAQKNHAVLMELSNGINSLQNNKEVDLATTLASSNQ